MLFDIVAHSRSGPNFKRFYEENILGQICSHLYLPQGEEEGGHTCDCSVAANDSSLHWEWHCFPHSLQPEDLAAVLVLIYRRKLITSFHIFVGTLSYSLADHLPFLLTASL